MRLLRRYPPEVHADPPPREEAPRGEVGDPARSWSRRRRTGGGRRGPARRLALYGSHVGVGDVGALRLPQCALYSPTLKESHALTSSSSTRRGAEDPRKSEGERGRKRGERTSASVSRGDLRANERARLGAPREREMRPIRGFQRVCQSRAACYRGSGDYTRAADLDRRGRRNEINCDLDSC